MRRELDTCQVQCPYCWQMFTLVVDCSVAHQEYVEDCEVCCRPITFIVRVDGEGGLDVVCRHEDGGG